MSWANRIAWVGAMVCLPLAAQSQNVWSWLDKEVIEKIKLTSQLSLGYHSHDVSGDREAYNIGNYGGYGDQTFTRLGYARLVGEDLGGLLDFELNIRDSRYQDPQAKDFVARIDEGPWRVEYGDVRATLNTGNQFVRFSKELQGINLEYEAGGLTIRTLTASAKGRARTISIQGTNSPGPYYLQSSQIVRGSEKIEVDGILQQIGVDYVIDYELGAITFIDKDGLNSKVIPPTSTIVASYESFGFNGSAGRIDGASLSYNMGQYGTIGVSAARQTTGGTGTLSTRLEKFAGFGPPSTPYFLEFEPLETAPIIIRVDGVLQVEGVDYNFDPNNPSIFYFTRFMPANVNIDVVYTPKPSTGFLGDRETYGIDYTLPLGSRGRLSIATATGRLYNSPNATSGTARAIDLRYGSGKWTFSGNARSVPSGFVSVESSTLNRNEEAHNFKIGFQADKRNLFDFSHLNASVTSLFLGDEEPTIQRTRFTRDQIDYTLLRDEGNNFPLSLSLAQTTTQNNLVDVRNRKASLSTNRQWGKFSASFGLESENVTGTHSAEIFSHSLRTAYNDGDKWTFRGNVSLNQISTGTESGRGHEYLFGINYGNPADDFWLGLTYSDYNAGGVTNLGYQSGYGSGYNGNGFSSGSSSPIFNGATNGRNLSLIGEWDVSERLSLIGTAGLRRSTGNISSNTETKSASLSVNYDLGSNTSLLAGFSRFETEFLEQPLQSTATSADLSIFGAPPGNLTYRLGASALLSGGTSQFSQDTFSLDLLMSYRLAKRHSLSLGYNHGSVNGYLPQLDEDLSMTYSYQIWESLALNLSYRMRDVTNTDPNLTSGQYRASGFDITLTFNYFR